MRVAALMLGLTLAGLPAIASAQTADNKWSADVYVGWDPAVNGNVHEGGVGSVGGDAAAIESRSWGDVYGTGMRWRFGGAYRLNDRSEVLGSLGYASATSTTLQIGTIGPGQAFARFDDYKNVGLEAGYRRYFADLGSAGRIKPYAGASVGVDFISGINAAVTVPQSGLVQEDVPFYDSTSAFAFGVNGGALYDINERFAVGGEIGLRYHSGLSRLNGLAGTGLENINDTGGRWTLPITVGLRVKFR